MTGYALREAIRDVLGHFWSESFGQIYPALADLESQGYVRRQDSARPGSSVYAITEAGLARLRELLSEPVQSAPPRNGLLLRLFFGRQLGPGACRELLRQAKADAERQLAQYRAIRQEIEQDPGAGSDRVYWLVTVSAGEHGAQGVIAWAEEALAALEQVAPEGSPGQEDPGHSQGDKQ
jgi:DNA-binding PadR family transcriptional regulator